MRVADTAALADGVRGYDRAVIVERVPVGAVVANGEAQLFLIFTVACTTLEICKKVGIALRLGGKRANRAAKAE